MPTKRLNDEHRPRIHPDLHPDADPSIRWADPHPPWHGPGDAPLQLRPDASEAVYFDGVWISPGEIAFANPESATAFGDLFVTPTPEGHYGRYQRLRAQEAERRAEAEPKPSRRKGAAKG